MAKVRIEWDAAGVLAAVSGRVVNGMDRACAFAAADARARAPKETGRLESSIDYEVVPVGLDIEGRIGGRRKGAFYLRFQELGTSKMAARPHLRPAVFANGATIVRLIEQG